ncbi:uncharacterized protein LTR77_008857 [Saxophila tyrrhenica]|uniref:NmrA-like domain-containing protein n=1 Tax=Saxophila tyrrhenica TaxID=1690608 RepID=A0AAV9P3R1_9PEZI|nr:hypothetical protein LTR77_008857 [Saxophila tyrrhenica]
MSSKKLITVFGATGNQGGSVLDVVLSRPDLQDRYSLRGITRDPESDKSKALNEKGVEMVKADVDDLEAVKAAVKGSYGVFGVTDFWSIMDKEREIKQGKNIFEASKEAGVKHLVWSALPYAEKLTEGALKHVEHFDSKAIVAEYAEANKGAMWVSHVMPAMFGDSLTRMTRVHEGQAALSMPFPSDSIAWPLIFPRRDYGKWVMGAFEAGESANGAFVNAVSTWTTPKEVVAAITKNANRDVAFNALPGNVFTSIMQQAMGEVVGEELSETMQLIGGWNYYGKEAEKSQGDHDKFLLKDAELSSYEQWAKENGPFKYE